MTDPAKEQLDGAAEEEERVQEDPLAAAEANAQQHLDDLKRLARPGRLGGVLARRPLAEVVELRLQTLERVQVLVALALELGDSVCRARPLAAVARARPRVGVCPFGTLDVPLGHEVGASSSTTSASSITSSSEGSAPLPALWAAD